MVCGGGGGAAVLGGVVKGRQCACARTCKHIPIFSVPQQVQHTSHSTKQVHQGSGGIGKGLSERDEMQQHHVEQAVRHGGVRPLCARDVLHVCQMMRFT